MKKKKKILLVDDTESNIEILVDLLDRKYNLLEAFDGQTAIDMANKNIPDLILLDVMMPNMDGYEVCKKLKKNKKTKNIPIIFITGKTDEDSIGKAYKIGAADYIGKPFKAKELKARIKTQLKIQTLICDVKQKTNKVTTLLNNAGQGFLVFDKNFIIDDKYSKECEKYLGSNMAFKDISNILFENNKKADKFKHWIADAVNMKDSIMQDSMITLLPNEIILNRRALKLEYKILEDKKVMLILTNITDKKKLEKKFEKEQSILKMIVAIVRDSDIFYDTKKDFEDFIKNKNDYIDKNKMPFFNINKLYRIIHTFKGLFLQLFMNDTAQYLHDIESKLAEFLENSKNIVNNQLIEFLDNIEFDSFMQNDLNDIDRLLGKKFIDNSDMMLVDIKMLKNIRSRYKNFIDANNLCDDVSKKIYKDMKLLTQKSLYSQLSPYARLTKQIAQRLKKEIHEFKIIGNQKILIPNEYKPFLKSLVHLFRNSVDHGIETQEKRLLSGKDEIGTISCSFSYENGILQIIVSDDGAGINVEKIKNKISKEINVDNLTDEEIYLYIFKDNMSTKDEISEISGRGIGMSAIETELKNINGTIKIKSELDIGTEFMINVPLD